MCMLFGSLTLITAIAIAGVAVARERRGQPRRQIVHRQLQFSHRQLRRLELLLEGPVLCEELLVFGEVLTALRRLHPDRNTMAVAALKLAVF